MTDPFIEEAVNWKDNAVVRFEEYTDVQSEKTFTALMRALQVAEDHMTRQREKLASEVEGMKLLPTAQLMYEGKIIKDEDAGKLFIPAYNKAITAVLALLRKDI